MPTNKRTCLFLMPYKPPTFRYFYLFMKNHIEKTHDLICSIVEEEKRLGSFAEKTIELIKKADIIIADCSGNNPNVLYELGWAHSHQKDVILITHDNTNDLAGNIRHIECIKYAFDNDLNFLDSMNNALNNIIEQQGYEEAHDFAIETLKRFKEKMIIRTEIGTTSKKEFIKLLKEKKEEISTDIDEEAMIKVILPAIIANSDQTEIMEAINNFIE